MGRPRTGAKAHAGNFSERKQTKQTNMFSHCPQAVHACTWIIDSIDHESFYVLIWIYKECTRAKQRLVFLRNLSFPRVFVSPGGHSVRKIRRTKSLSQNSWKHDFVIVNILVLYWLDMSHLILASCSRHLLFASLKLAIRESVVLR